MPAGSEPAAGATPGHQPAQSVAGKDRGEQSRLTNLAQLMSVVPLVVLIYLIQSTWVDVPYSDQWTFALQLREWRGSPDLYELASFHNEHRLLFPRLLMIALGHWSQWDVRFEMGASVLLATVTFILLRKLLQTGLVASPFATAIASACTAVVVFSPLQWENWLWGWQVQWFLSVVTLVGAVSALHCWPKEWSALLAVATASMAAFVSQFSLASGTFVWASVLVMLFAQRRYWRHLPVWALFAIVSNLVYFRGYDRPDGHPPLAGLEDFRRLSAYLFTYVGRSVTAEDWAAAAGVVLVVLGLIAVYGLTSSKVPFGQYAPWVALMVYGALSAVVTALGRVGFGVGQARSSRYTTISSLIVVSVCALITIAVEHRLIVTSRAPKAALATLALAPFLLVAALVIMAVPSAHQQMLAQSSSREASRACVSEATVATDPCLDHFAPFAPERILYAMTFLRERNWGP